MIPVSKKIDFVENTGFVREEVEVCFEVNFWYDIIKIKYFSSGGGARLPRPLVDTPLCFQVLITTQYKDLTL